MTNFDYTQKNRHLYLDVAANGSGQDKSWLTLEALRRLSDEGRKRVDMVEIGPGGGVAIDSLVDSIEAELPQYIGHLGLRLIELDGIESESLKKARTRFNAVGKSELVYGDAQELDAVLGQESTDVITACAVFHEVYSYGGGERGLSNAFLASNRTLRPGGYLAYRDVLTVPKASLHDQERVSYNEQSWVQFTKMFLPYYLDNATHPYMNHMDIVEYEQNGARIRPEKIDSVTPLDMIAPIGVSRELQRHYITMRDIMWRSHVLGVTPILEGENAPDWINYESGERLIHFTTDDTAFLDQCMKDRDGNCVLESDSFETIVDKRLYEVLKRAEADDQSEGAEIWRQWIAREGCETYMYATVDQLIGAVALSTYDDTGGSKILLPQFTGISPRPHYTRYTKRRIENSCADGGQRILFQSIDRESNTKQGVECALKLVREVCTVPTSDAIHDLVKS